jgi:uncharacterized membrane protein YbhN (UPF0104 family)
MLAHIYTHQESWSIVASLLFASFAVWALFALGSSILRHRASEQSVIGSYLFGYVVWFGLALFMAFYMPATRDGRVRAAQAKEAVTQHQKDIVSQHAALFAAAGFNAESLEPRIYSVTQFEGTGKATLVIGLCTIKDLEYEIRDSRLRIIINKGINGQQVVILVETPDQLSRQFPTCTVES